MVEYGSLAIAGLALALSAFTTYRAFFDKRVTLTASVDRVSAQVQSSGSRSGDQVTRSFRYYPNISFILSHLFASSVLFVFIRVHSWFPLRLLVLPHSLRS